METKIRHIVERDEYTISAKFTREGVYFTLTNVFGCPIDFANIVIWTDPNHHWMTDSSIDRYMCRTYYDIDNVSGTISYYSDKHEPLHTTFINIEVDGDNIIINCIDDTDVIIIEKKVLYDFPEELGIEIIATRYKPEYFVKRLDNGCMKYYMTPDTIGRYWYNNYELTCSYDF